MVTLSTGLTKLDNLWSLEFGDPSERRPFFWDTLYIEIQDQVKKWRPNLWNVTHSYRWLFSNKVFIIAFFVEISTATPHQLPCQTFVLVFGMTLEIKNLRKTIFEFYQFPVKIILVGLCLKSLNSIEKLHNLLNE